MGDTTSTIRLKDLRGCPVLSASDGARLGRVSEVLLDIDERRIAGFRLRSGGLLARRWRIAAMEDVTAIEPGLVRIADERALLEDVRPSGRLALGRRGPLVRVHGGAVLGRATDALADAATGRLICLLVQPAAASAAPLAMISIPAEQLHAEQATEVVVGDGARSVQWAARSPRTVT